MELEVSRKRGNQLLVEGRDEVYLTLQAKLWPSLGRHEVAGSTALSQRWLQLQPSQPGLPRNVPTLWMGKIVVSRPVKSCHQFLLKKKVSTGGVKKPHHYKPGTVALQEI